MLLGSPSPQRILSFKSSKKKRSESSFRDVYGNCFSCGVSNKHISTATLTSYFSAFSFDPPGSFYFTSNIPAPNFDDDDYTPVLLGLSRLYVLGAKY